MQKLPDFLDWALSARPLVLSFIFEVDYKG